MIAWTCIAIFGPAALAWGYALRLRLGGVPIPESPPDSQAR